MANKHGDDKDMSKEDLNLNSTWRNAEFPRGKHHNKTETKTTVSVYLSKNLVEKAKENGLNLSKILEEALNSILNYVEAPNCETESSKFLNRLSFQKESRAGSLARLGHPLDVRKVTGSNPVRPTYVCHMSCLR